MAIKAKALIDGKEVDVELVAPPEGYFSQAQLDRTVKDREKAAELSTRASVLDDEEFATAFYQHKGIDLEALKSGAKPVDLEAELRRLEPDWRRKHVDPVQRKLDTASALAEQLKVRAIEASLSGAAAKHGVLQGIQNRFPRLYSDQFAYDVETGKVLQVQDGAPVYNTQGQPKTADDFLGELKADPANAALFQPTTQAGPGAKPNANAGGKPVYRTEAEFRANMKAIAAGEATYEPGG